MAARGRTCNDHAKKRTAPFLVDAWFSLRVVRLGVNSPIDLHGDLLTWHNKMPRYALNFKKDTIHDLAVQIFKNILEFV